MASAAAILSGPMEIRAVALGAFVRSACAVRRLELRAALGALERSLVGHHDRPSLENEHTGLKQGARDLLSGAGDDAAERRPGDTHALRGLFVIQAEQVGQAERLHLVETELDGLEPATGHAGRLEPGNRGLFADEAAFAGSHHAFSL